MLIFMVTYIIALKDNNVKNIENLAHIQTIKFIENEASWNIVYIKNLSPYHHFYNVLTLKSMSQIVTQFSMATAKVSNLTTLIVG